MTSADSSSPVIVTDKLSTTFTQGGRQHHVLRNIDLEIERGSFTVIMGPSGSGKSTLLYALSGMDAPTLGSVVVDGIEISGLSADAQAKFRRNHCGFVFQQMHLIDGLNVLENLMVLGLLTNGDRREVRHRALSLLERVGLPERDAAKHPSMLSGGEAQRVGIARALMNTPTIVFADEPTGQLNSSNSQKVLDLLNEVNREGQTVVMVTHDIHSAERADRICFLRDGHIRSELQLEPFTETSRERTESVTSFLAECGW
ncbi:ABC transporter ATP-binding protein [Gulosibacter bifidus]|uniref:ABC transporter ATP-binding protein n=1 Tax=Gulosibacter bifidus TaxID=272239 RepID=A0ABW5RJ85_9MICO|nr:ABC transporter ATP-binding protein [Gulosibacter bifidus]